MKSSECFKSFKKHFKEKVYLCTYTDDEKFFVDIQTMKESFKFESIDNIRNNIYLCTNRNKEKFFINTETLKQSHLFDFESVEPLKGNVYVCIDSRGYGERFFVDIEKMEVVSYN